MFIHSFMGRKRAIDSDDYNLARDESLIGSLKAIRQVSQSWLSVAVCSWSIAFGGTLSQQIDNRGRGNRLELRTPFITEKVVLWSVYLVRPSQINSVHHQSIKDLALFRATVALGDNTIEAIGLWMAVVSIGLQWHPSFDQRRKGNLELFQYLLQV